MSVGQVRDEPPSSPRWAPARTDGGRWTRSTGIQLLVVDPDDGDRETVTSVLGTEGVSVTWCTNAVDGLIAYGRLDPDAVIVTPRLDDLDACDFVKAVKRHDSRLVLVGLDESAAGAVGPLFLAGAASAVARPYDAEEVMHG